jgi:hypothetical protein
MVGLIRGALATLLLVATAGCLFQDAAGPLTVEPAELPRARAGTPYEARIRIEGNVTPVGGMSVSDGALPAGLELAIEPPTGTDSGLISGVPQTPGTYRFKVFVWCYGTQTSGQTANVDYTLVVE